MCPPSTFLLKNIYLHRISLWCIERPLTSMSTAYCVINPKRSLENKTVNRSTADQIIVLLIDIEVNHININSLSWACRDDPRWFWRSTAFSIQSRTRYLTIVAGEYIGLVWAASVFHCKNCIYQLELLRKPYIVLKRTYNDEYCLLKPSELQTIKIK